MSEVQEVQVVEEAPPVVVQKSKKGGTGDFLFDTAQKIENLTKSKALAEADRLFTTVETNYFEMGGVLGAILTNSWFDGYESFGAFVSEKYGFKERKARYLINSYDTLVKNQIPWDKVKDMGWTKLSVLAESEILTAENVDEWVTKATTMSVAELRILINEIKNPSVDGVKSSTTSDSVSLKFKVHSDQVETIQSALSKAKAEVSTEHDNVALEMICAGYLGGTSSVPVVKEEGTLIERISKLMETIGWEGTLTAFGEKFPAVNITVS